MKNQSKMLLALLMVFGLLAAACGSDEDDTETPGTDGAGATTEAMTDDTDGGTGTTEAMTDDTEAMTDDTEAMADGDLEELNVAYFLEWPTANLAAQQDGTYDEELGLTVNWIPFASGGDMATAMDAGEIDISYSQGLTPFANFVTSGSDHVIVGVAVSYADADNCVADGSLGITADNASETLAGAKIYTPLGNVTHFKLLKMLEFLEVDTSSVELIQSEGGQAAVAALQGGEVAMACAFGGAVNTMIANGGNVVMTGTEQEEIGIRVFDITSAPRAFAEAHGDVITAFLQVTEDTNTAFLADPDSFKQSIADASEMDLEPSNELLAAFAFPDKETQLSDEWLGGTVQSVMKEQMDFFVEQGEIEGALDSYDQFIDTSYLEAVS